MSQNQFDYSLHGFRGIAASMVYVGHSSRGFYEHNCSSCDSGIMPKIVHIGSFGVELFFFLSGYVIYAACKRASAKTFFSHRFWRIYPVFILFTVAFFALNAVTNQFPEKAGLDNFLYNIFFLNLFVDTPALTPNAWTITYEIWYYIGTFCIVVPILRRMHRALLLAGVPVLLYFLWYEPITLFYLAGVGTKIFEDSRPNWQAAWSARWVNMAQLVSGVVLIWLASIDVKYTWAGVSAGVTIPVLLLVLTIFMLSIVHRASWLNQFLHQRFFMVLGTVSYTLYLAHPYSHLVARELSGMMFDSYSIAQLGLYLIMNLLLTVVLVYLVHKIVEVYCYERYTGKALFVPEIETSRRQP